MSPHSPKESDWKRFRAIVPVLRERYLAERNRTIAGLVGTPGRDETDRFWDVHEFVQKEAKTLRLCLDGHSRSKMWQFMYAMRSVGMLTDEDLNEFSPELQEMLKRE
jgi:hypothetical protein